MTDLPPILRDFPESFTSERLLIRAPRAGDGAAIHAAVVESLAELRPWMPWAQGEQTVEAAEASLREARADFLARRDLRLHLYRRGDGALIGSSGLTRIHWEVPAFEIGYWVRTSETDRGYATEAARRIAEFAFDELAGERVEIWCDARNERSARVAVRAFRPRGTAEPSPPGRSRPSVGLALLRPLPRLISASRPTGPPPPNKSFVRNPQNQGRKFTEC